MAKQPKTKALPQAGGGGRNPKTNVSVASSPSHDLPVVSFQYADREAEKNPWPWPEGDALGEMIHFLCGISTTTWHELRNQMWGGKDRHRKHHGMAFDVVCEQAQQRLAKSKLDEVFDEFFRFRLDGKTRLWGFERSGVFYLLWWDPDHSVYPV